MLLCPYFCVFTADLLLPSFSTPLHAPPSNPDLSLLSGGQTRPRFDSRHNREYRSISGKNCVFSECVVLRGSCLSGDTNPMKIMANPLHHCTVFIAFLIWILLVFNQVPYTRLTLNMDKKEGDIEFNGQHYYYLADGHYDAIVMGTGIKECILSGLLSAHGWKVCPSPPPRCLGPHHRS